MKQSRKAISVATVVYCFFLQVGAKSPVLYIDRNEEEKAVTEYPHFFEGLPPGVTEEKKSKDSLTYYFHKPQKSVDVEIYDDSGVLVCKDSRSVNRYEAVSYSLPNTGEGTCLVLIRCDDEEVYGNNYYFLIILE